MSMTIPVSFKDSELDLYLKVKQKGDISGYIKSLVRRDMELSRTPDPIVQEFIKEAPEKPQEPQKHKISEPIVKNANSFI